MRRKGSRLAQYSVLKTTLLVVGEGADDKAFITHMKNVFCPRGCGLSVKVEAGDGGSPGNIITNAMRSFKSAEYGRRILILDADVPPTDVQRKKASDGGYEIILWSPQCLEGALLDVLGERVAQYETSQELKDRLHPKLKAYHTDPKAYEPLFPKTVLEETENYSVAKVRTYLRPKQ
ncbi:MAG TPA: hypothetical protein VIZ65_01000 [Cellvibrionaceae bacterium]